MTSLFKLSVPMKRNEMKTKPDQLLRSQIKEADKKKNEKFSKIREYQNKLKIKYNNKIVTPRIKKEAIEQYARLESRRERNKKITSPNTIPWDKEDLRKIKQFETTLKAQQGNTRVTKRIQAEARILHLAEERRVNTNKVLTKLIKDSDIYQKPINFYTITIGPKFEVKKLATANHSIVIKFDAKKFLQLRTQAAIEAKIKESIDEILKYVINHEKLSGDDRISIKFSRATSDWIQKVKDLNTTDFLKHHERFFQSWENQKMTDDLVIYIITVKIPKGAGKKLHLITEEDLKNKHSIIQIKNTDQLCAARAIVVGDARNNKLTNPSLYAQIIKSEKTKQTKMAKALYDEMGKSYDDQCSLDDIITIEEILNVSVSIVDFNNKNQFVYEGVNHIDIVKHQALKIKLDKCMMKYENELENDDIEEDEKEEQKDKLAKMLNYINDIKSELNVSSESRQKIYLLQKDNHYHLITSMSGYLGTQKFCPKCNVGYKDNHRCKGLIHCSLCNSDREDHYKTREEMDSDCPEKYEQWFSCNSCNRAFPTEKCYNAHIFNLLKGNLSICEFKYKCNNSPSCGLLNVERDGLQKDHKCGTVKCSNCKLMLEKDHQCFIQKCKSNLKKNHKYFYYDFESKTGAENHIVNYAVLQNEEGIETSFTNIDDFCKHIFTNTYSNSTFLAHNAKGYDGIFIHNWLMNNRFVPHVIYAGSKIMSLEIQKLGIKLIDSMNFIPSSLSSFEKTFGLKELHKGYFPHLFNIDNNQKYIGQYPDTHFYSPDRMKNCGDPPSKVKSKSPLVLYSESEHKELLKSHICENNKKTKCQGCRDRFLRWHKMKIDTNAIFDFEKEMALYCSSDVNLLREGITSFRHNFLEKTNNLVDPLQCITIASAVMKSYRCELLEENTIAMVYNDNVLKDDILQKTILYLEYTKHTECLLGNKVDINHMKNGGKHSFNIETINTIKNKLVKSIETISVDGYDQKSNTVWELNSCFWNGCNKCYKDQSTVNPINHKTMGSLNSKLVRKQKLLDNVCTYKSMWECDFDAQDLKTKVKSWMSETKYYYQETLNPRESFMGGRTNACRLKYDCKPDEKIHYSDFTSLYPSINKYGIYPIGHPKIIKEFNDLDVSKYTGLIKCKVLPPRGLYHPVLPTKRGLKLMFGLCGQCMSDNLNVNECNHTNDERSIIGSWTHLELHKAIEKGYIITEIHEVHQFDQFRQGLYAPFVDKWMKVKQESSGFPANVETKEQKLAYIADYKNHENIELEYENIEKNPGRRTTAKLILNSFWGKLGQRDNMVQDAYFDNPSKYFQLICDDKVNIESINIVAENSLTQDGLIHVSYTMVSGFVKPAKNTNVYHAVYTTSQARLKLFDVMDSLGHRVLYHDTDSVIYVIKDNETIPNVKLGNYLGDLTDELDDGDHIVKFRSAGPKDYSYLTYFGHVCVKVKGFTLNYEASEVVNMNSMFSLIEGSNPLTESKSINFKVPTMEFINNKKKSTIKTNNTTKEYRFEYNSRLVDWENYKTYPYGY